jgi:hypothetical protein
MGGLLFEILMTQLAYSESIKLKESGGVYMLPVRINDTVTVPFVLDSGAAEVSIPSDVFSVLKRSDTINQTDFIGTSIYTLADGTTVSSDRYILHKMGVGDHIITEVVANVVSVKGDPLLGQSFLQKLPAWTLDNAQHALVLQDNSGERGVEPQTAVRAPAPPLPQPSAPLGGQVTASQVGVDRCWNGPANAGDAKDLVVVIRVIVDPDGTVQQATIVDQARLSDPMFRLAAERARRAFFNPQCRPLHLLPGRIWRDLAVSFSSKD